MSGPAEREEGARFQQHCRLARAFVTSPSPGSFDSTATRLDHPADSGPPSWRRTARQAHAAANSRSRPGSHNDPRPAVRVSPRAAVARPISAEAIQARPPTLTVMKTRRLVMIW